MSWFQNFGNGTDHKQQRSKRAQRQLRVEELEQRDVPATYYWMGSDPPANPPVPVNWDAFKVWQLDGVRVTSRPSNGDTVIFNDTSSQDSVNNIDDLSLAKLDIVGGAHAYIGTLTLNKTLTVSSGTLSTQTPSGNFSSIKGPGDFIIPNGGTYTWTSGTMSGAGKTVVKMGGTLNINSSSAIQQDARLAGRTLQVDGNGAGYGTVNFTGQIFCQNDPADNKRAASINNEGRFNISGADSALIAGEPAVFTNVRWPPSSSAWTRERSRLAQCGSTTEVRWVSR